MSQDLLDELNDMRSDALGYENLMKVESLRSFLLAQNVGQGLGFMMFDVVLDKRKLAKYAAVAFSSLSTVVIGLLAYAKEADD
jgi:ABC-type tungstate transport system substrate-binding protein